jgi:hypothetical protein
MVPVAVGPAGLKARRGKKPVGVAIVLGVGITVEKSATVTVLVTICLVVEAERVATTIEQLVDVTLMKLVVIGKGLALKVSTVPAVTGYIPNLVVHFVVIHVPF